VAASGALACVLILFEDLRQVGYQISLHTGEPAMTTYLTLLDSSAFRVGVFLRFESGRSEADLSPSSLLTSLASKGAC
jgi:hypothetical protein